MVSTTSTRSLLAVNAATVALALALDWPVATLLWPYWVQSIIIGYFSCKRILALGRFSTEGLTMNDRAVSPTVATQRSVASFFAVHYGFFHIVYLVFLMAQHTGQLRWWDWAGLLVLGVSFAWNHRLSFNQNVEADRAGTPNIGIVGGALGGDSAWSVLVFGSLKTAADVLMHHVEHRVLQRQRAPATA